MNRNYSRRFIDLINYERLTGWQIHVLCEAELFNGVYIYYLPGDANKPHYSHNGNTIKSLIRRKLLRLHHTNKVGFETYDYYSVFYKESN